MGPNPMADRRDPVQEYCLRRSRRRRAILALLLLVVLGVGYWYVYLL